MLLGTTSLAAAAIQLCDVNTTDPHTRQLKINVFAVFRPTRSSTLPPDTWIHQTRHLQQPTTTLRETATHIFFYRLISPKPVGASSLIVSFHFTLYRHDIPY